MGQTAYSGYMAFALTEGREHRDYREKVGTVGGVGTESRKRSPLGDYGTLRIVSLGEACAGIHKYIHYGEVRLQRVRVQPLYLHPSEDGACHQEVCCRAPVAFQVKFRRPVVQAALDFEVYAAAEVPVAGFQEVGASEHIVRHLYPELAQHFQAYIHIWNALRFADRHGRIL